MYRLIPLSLLVALLTLGCRGSTPTPGDQPQPPATGENGGGTAVTDPGKIYDPTMGLDTDRETAAKMDMDELIASLGDEDLAPAATDELTTRGSESVQPLIAALDDDNPTIRQRAIFTLGRLGPIAKEALPKLQEIADDSDDETLADSAKFAIDAIQGN